VSGQPKRQRVLLVGVGGQGVLTAGNVLGDAALAAGLPVMVGQLHGMSQRGGAVECALVLGPGRSAFIGAGDADVVVAFEPLEALRALPRTKPGATVIVSREPIVPLSISTTGGEYPSFDEIEARLRTVAGRVVAADPGALAGELGDARVASAVMVGVLVGAGVLPIDRQTVGVAVEQRSPKAMRELNRRAFERGVRAAGGDAAANQERVSG